MQMQAERAQSYYADAFARLAPEAGAASGGLVMAAIYRTLLAKSAATASACWSSASRSLRCASSGSRGGRETLGLRDRRPRCRRRISGRS
jgi:hypothetical protein